VLWSFVYLVVRNLFALVWLLGRPRRSKELEILVLRHELALLRRQPSRPRVTRADRALMGTLSPLTPPTCLDSLLVKPETLLRWHRQLIARRYVLAALPGRPPLAPPTDPEDSRVKPHWGYKRIVGELKVSASVSATSVRRCCWRLVSSRRRNERIRRGGRRRKSGQPRPALSRPRHDGPTR
jgi:putative transposase